MKAMYIGQGQYYNKTACAPVFLTMGKFYNIIILYWDKTPWKWLVALEDEKGVTNWIPYNVNPLGKYWQKL